MEMERAKRRKLDHETGNHIPGSLDSADAAGFLKPGAFILETEELLKEVRVDYGALEDVEQLLHSVKNCIEAIEPHGPLPILEAASKLEKNQKIAIPFPDPKPAEDSPYKVAFTKPSQCNVVGSYASRTMVSSQKEAAVDMIVVMPNDVFQEKDYLGLRYFYKRAYYLATIAGAVRKELGVKALAFEYMNGNTLLPVLLVNPIATKGAKALKSDQDGSNRKESSSGFRCHVRIIPCAEVTLFPKHKLWPTRNSVRFGTTETDGKTKSPTPFYNSTLKAEGSFLSYLRIIRQAGKNCAAFQNACILGRIWLQQRGFKGSISQGGFGHFEWAALLALLLQSGGRKGQAALSSSLNCTQLFKAVIQFLSTTDLLKKPCVLGPSPEDLNSVREPGPVLFDSIRQVNLCYKMSPASARFLQQHAKWTNSLLGDSVIDQFGSTFITKADLPLQTFDLVFKVQDTGGMSSSTGRDLRPSNWDFSNTIYNVLTKALGDRVRLIHTQVPEMPSWSVSTTLKGPDSLGVLVGVLFDQNNVSRQVDHGPAVEDKHEAKKFRQFWGDKAELRRFKDGSILESLIWTSASPSDLSEEIIRYILQRHVLLDYEKDGLVFYGKDFLALRPVKASDAAAFSAVRHAFEVFEKDVRGLEDLPLQVRQLAPTAPGFRGSSVKAPSLDNTKPGALSLDVVIFFETSGKWPDSLAAIQRAKIAFLLKIGSSLEETKPGITTHIGLEDAGGGLENLSFLDIVYDNGISFRLRIHSDLEENFLERRITDKTIEQHVRTESVQLLATFRRLYTILPLHTQTVSTFCTRFPALSQTIRLVKYWFDAHKLSCHFTEEFVELVALHHFLEPYPWDAPSSSTTGFLRALLFLSRWDWRVEPLIVDMSGELAASDRSAISTRLKAWRNIDPNMNHTVLVVATSHDSGGTAYTTTRGAARPSKVVATRMTTLARSACRLIKDRGVDLDARALFTPSLKDYDMVIHLSSKSIGSTMRTYSDDRGGDAATNRPSQFKNLDARTGKTPLPIATPSARALLDRLNAAFAGPLLFFHGGLDDPVIAGIWNPQVTRRSFRVNLPCSYKPAKGVNRDDGDANRGHGWGADDEDDVVEVNREAILAEIARVGGDLVERIEDRTAGLV